MKVRFRCKIARSLFHFLSDVFPGKESDEKTSGMNHFLLILSFVPLTNFSRYYCIGDESTFQLRLVGLYIE